MDQRQSVEIRVRGTVQGVGFRPAVWRLAHDEGLVGEVCNDGFGLLIRVTGSDVSIARFQRRMSAEAPPLSHVEEVVTRRLTQVREFVDFRIIDSETGENHTRVAADAALCAACRAEVLDPADRRHAYPFANCTHCGPRFSIVTAAPYDRVHTTMAEFPMCSACAAEYANPADRRFHAQAIACPTCGPSIWLESFESNGPAGRFTSGESLRAAVQLLEAGAIVALRGLGGFHLTCDATNAQTVERLRARKQRYGKPFALMARDLDTIRRYCTVTLAEAELLCSAEAPIVLLAADGPELLPAAVASGLATLGFMLPYTPLHVLVLQHFARPLVMTSGNVSDEPQVTSLPDARIELRGIADAGLMHNRGIANRVDDSVVRVVAGRPRVIRRARGYAPGALRLPAGFDHAPDLLAFGGQSKAAFCIVKDGAAVLSQHQGDLENIATLEDYQHNLRLYSEMVDHRPRLLVADAHPAYLATQLARQRSAADALPLIEVQHHHAHITSCMVENGVPLDAPPLLGIALDGSGFGDDGTIWGGEFLWADYRGYQRLGTLKEIALPGGAQAIREPWRNTYAHLVAGLTWERVMEEHPTLELVRRLSTKPLAVIDRMLATGLNVPRASSCGRLFDAVAAALGLCAENALYEGQAAHELEAIATPWPAAEAEPPYPFSIQRRTATGMFCLDPTPMWQALLADLDRRTSAGRISARFHHGLAWGIRAMIARIRDAAPGGCAVDTVALSGGCLQNKLLLEALTSLLEADGLRCLSHSIVPANDGGLSLGQAAIAAARHLG